MMLTRAGKDRVIQDFVTKLLYAIILVSLAFESNLNLVYNSSIYCEGF